MHLHYPNFNPVLFAIGPFSVHWYGIMYLLGFAVAWLLARQRAARIGLAPQQISDMIFYGILGVIIGGRLGYVLFYGFEQFWQDPLWLFAIWQGGMSFHGGLIGVLLATWFFARKHQLAFFQLTDFIAPIVPVGLGAGRIGNFINQELPGRVSTVPWAIDYPHYGSALRHPSAIYQFATEGVLLFAILWWISCKPHRRGMISGLFLLLYGVFRFITEFFRLPDPQLGFIAFNWLTMGQLLCLPMIFIGIGLLAWSRKQLIDQPIAQNQS